MIRGEVKTKVLKYLSPSEPKRFIEIHKESGIAQSSLAKFLTELVRDGFVKRTGKGYLLTESGNITLEFVEEQVQIIGRHSVILALVDSKKKVELSKSDKSTLKNDLAQIENWLVGLMGFTEYFHTLVLRSEGKSTLSHSIEFEWLVGIVIDFERFFYKVASVLGFKDEFVGPFGRTGIRSITDEELEIFKTVSKEQVIGVLSDFTDSLRKACMRAENDFKGYPDLKRSFDVMIRCVDDYKEALEAKPGSRSYVSRSEA